MEGWLLHLCTPELKLRTTAHTEQLGWYVEFESRVTHRQLSLEEPVCEFGQAHGLVARVDLSQHKPTTIAALSSFC